MTPFSNKGPILHRDSISFHLSHKPPLSVMCNFYVVKMSLLGGKVSLSLHKKWHITDRGGWWLKWKLILSRWRIGPLFENGVTFVIDFQKVVCVWRHFSKCKIQSVKAACKMCPIKTVMLENARVVYLQELWERAHRFETSGKLSRLDCRLKAFFWDKKGQEMEKRAIQHWDFKN